LLALIGLALAFFTGCGGGGGFQESASGIGNNGSAPAQAVVYFQGQVLFGANPSLSIGSIGGVRSSVQKVSGASVDVYLAEDFLYANSMLRPQEQIVTSSDGQFAILQSQLKSEALTKTLVIRARFGNTALSTVVNAVGSSSRVAESLAISSVSDSIVRYFQEEIGQKIAKSSTLTEIQNAPWKQDLIDLAFQLGESRNTLIRELSPILPFTPSDHDETQSLSSRASGKKFLVALETKLGSSSEVQEFLRLAEQTRQFVVENNQGTINEVSTGVRVMQLFSAFLRQGFFVSDLSGRVYSTHRWENLELSKAPELMLTATVEQVLESFASTVTSADYTAVPPPLKTLSFRPVNLSVLKSQGQAFDEVASLIARDSLRYPWVTVKLIEHLAGLVPKGMLTLEQSVALISQNTVQKRQPEERVKTTLASGGLVIPQELVAVAQEYGGLRPVSSSLLNTIVSVPLLGSREAAMQSIIDAKPVYLAAYSSVLRLKHHQIQASNASILDPSVVYPDPLSEISTRFLIQAKISNNRTFGSAYAQRQMELTEAAFLSLKSHRDFLSVTAATLPTNLLLNLSQISALMAMVPGIATPLSTGLGYFRDLPAIGGQSPRVSNLSHMQIGPVASESMWKDILNASGRSSQFATMTAVLLNLENSLQPLSITTLNWMRTIPSGANNRKARGFVFLGEPGSIEPAARFLISARTSPTATPVITQTLNDGSYVLEGLKGDSELKVDVEVKDVLSGSVIGTTVRTLTLTTFISGYEDEIVLENFYLLPAIRQVASGPVTNSSLIRPANALPTVTIKSLPSVTSATVAVSFEVCDEESNPVDLRFSFTSGETFLTTTSAPKISTSSNSSATFPLDGILTSLPSRPPNRCVTEPLILYWHSRIDLGLGGLLGEKSQQNVRITAAVRESLRTTQFDTAVLSNLFNLDNEPPTVTFSSPLPTDPETTKTSIDVIGKASDLSTVVSVIVSNASLREGSATTYQAINLGSGFGDWQAKDVLVESGIENSLHVYAEDIFGNRNKSPYILKFRALDAQPPILKVTSITVFSSRNVPAFRSLDSQFPLTYVTVALPPDSIRYEFSPTQAQSVAIDLLTTGSIEISGTLTDISGVALMRYNNQNFDVFSINGVDHTFRRSVDLSQEAVPFSASSTSLRIVISALDKKNNDSRATAYNDVFKSLYNYRLFVDRLDVSPPVVALLEPTSSAGSTLLQTSNVALRLTALDESGISTFILCSSLLCQSATTSTDGSYRVTLPISERASNRITGQVSDFFGFTQFYTDTSPLVTFNLNDITPPSLILTGILNAVSAPGFLPKTIDQSYPDAPRSVIDVIRATSCSLPVNGVVTSCSVSLSGILSDVSGFDLGVVQNNFVGFRMRMNSSSGNQFNPAVASRAQLYGVTDPAVNFPNLGNVSVLQTFSLPEAVDSLGVQTRVPFLAELRLSDDGYWPLVIDLQDNSKTLFSPHTKRSIRKREVLYLQKDTSGPVLSDLSIQSGMTLTSGKFTLSGKAVDQLSEVTSVLAAQVPASFGSGPFNLSVWRNFVTLPEQSSRSFTATVTLPSGSQVLSLTAADGFGNLTTQNISLSILPLYQQTIKAEAQFTEPFFVGFTGNSYSNFIVADRARSRIEVLDSKGEVSRTLLGDTATGSGFSTLTTWITVDSFWGKQGTLSLESFSLHGQFARTAIEITNTLARFRPDGSQEGGTASLPYRTGVTASLTLTYPLGTLVRFAPIQRLDVFSANNHVNFVYTPSINPAEPRLRRYVSSARDLSPTSYPSEGGRTASTASVGTGPTSTISSMVITQAHTGGLGPADDPVISLETVHLVEPQSSLIHRYQYNNRVNNFGFSTLAPLNLGPGIAPGVIEMEVNGSVMYISDTTSHKILKFSMASGTPVTVTSFGGFGHKPGQFLSIDAIRGFRPPGAASFLKLYVVDSRAQRISVFTTDGVLEGYLGKNPYAAGGFVEPRLLGTAYDSAMVLDARLDGIDSITAAGEIQGRQIISDLSGSGLSSLSSVLFIQREKTVTENTQNYLNPQYFTQSLEQFSISTNSLFLMTSTALIRQTITQSTSFTAVLTNDQRLVTVSTQAQNPVYTQFTQAVSSFFNLKGFSYAKDTEDRYFFVEDLPGSDRVQMLSPQTGVNTQSNLAQQSGSIGICTLSTGLAVVGTSPAHMVQFMPFSTGTKLMTNNASFLSLPLLNYSLVSYPITTPTALACQDNMLAVADTSGQVGIFTLEPGLGFTLIQEISKAGTETLSGPLSITFADKSLFVSEINRSRVHRFTVRQ